MAQDLRLFIALELPSEVLRALEALQAELRAHVPERAARWVRSEGIHLTLKFLGDVPEGEVEAIEAALKVAVRGRAPFELQAGGMGVFPNAARARVLWVGIGGEVEALQGLRAAVEAQVAPLGYPTERRRFSPHLTLARAARNASRAERLALGALAEGGAAPPIVSWQAQTVGLIRSQLKPSGAVYTTLAAIPLAAR